MGPEHSWFVLYLRKDDLERFRCEVARILLDRAKRYEEHAAEQCAYGYGQYVKRCVHLVQAGAATCREGSVERTNLLDAGRRLTKVLDDAGL